jgi:serine/threonine protein kinase
MDYFDGVPLEEYVREHGPLPAADVKAVARTVAEALRAAHGKNILHRDVKPAKSAARAPPKRSHEAP